MINPYTREPIALVRQATAADIAAAQEAWGKTLASQREAILCRAADLVEKRRMEIAKVLIEEGGNVFGKAMLECDYMITFRIAAGRGRRHRPLPAHRQEARASAGGRQCLRAQALALRPAGGAEVRRDPGGSRPAAGRIQRHPDHQ
nr:aldehyde dehydrogenase family protein [Azoarcus indigens]